MTGRKQARAEPCSLSVWNAASFLGRERLGSFPEQEGAWLVVPSGYSTFFLKKNFLEPFFFVACQDCSFADFLIMTLSFLWY